MPGPALLSDLRVFNGGLDGLASGVTNADCGALVAGPEVDVPTVGERAFDLDGSTVADDLLLLDHVVRTARVGPGLTRGPLPSCRHTTGCGTQLHAFRRPALIAYLPGTQRPDPIRLGPPPGLPTT